MNPIKVASLVAVSLVSVGWGAANYVSPECLAVAPDGASVYVTSATGAHVQNVALDGSATRFWKVESANGKPSDPTGIAVAGSTG